MVENSSGARVAARASLRQSTLAEHPGLQHFSLCGPAGAPRAAVGPRRAVTATFTGRFRRGVCALLTDGIVKLLQAVQSSRSTNLSIHQCTTWRLIVVGGVCGGEGWEGGGSSWAAPVRHQLDHVLGQCLDQEGTIAAEQGRQAARCEGGAHGGGDGWSSPAPRLPQHQLLQRLQVVLSENPRRELAR